MSQNQTISIGREIRESGRHTIVYGLGSVAQSASAFILLPILTASLTPADFGAYSLILVVGIMAGTVFYFGMTSALPRSYFDYSSDNDRRAVFTTAFLVLLFGVLLQSLLGILLGEWIAIVLLGDARFATAVSYGLCSAAFALLNVYFFGFLRLLRKSVVSVLFSLGSLVGTIVLTLLLLSHEPASVAAPFEAAAWVQGILAVLFVTIYRSVAFEWRVITEELPKLLHFGLASVVASFGNVLIDSLDRLMIQHLIGLTEVGVYSAAIRVSTLISVVLILPFMQIWSPMMMEYRNRNNIGELFTKVFSIFMILGGLIVVGCALFASDILSLLIRSSLTPLSVVIFLAGIVGLLLSSAANFFAAGLFYERKVHLLPYVYFGVAALKFAAGMLLISTLGLAGAAISAFISSCAVSIAVYLISRKYFHFVIEWRRLGMFVVVSAPAVLFGFVAIFLPPLAMGWRIVWMLITILLVFCLCLSEAEKSSVRLMFRRGSGREF